MTDEQSQRDKFKEAARELETDGALQGEAGEAGEAEAGAREPGMRWHRFAVLAVWTLAFLLVGRMALEVLAMGGCPPGPEGAGCRDFRSAQPFHIVIGEAVIYAGLTWAIFIRRWRKS